MGKKFDYSKMEIEIKIEPVSEEEQKKRIDKINEIVVEMASKYYIDKMKGKCK